MWTSELKRYKTKFQSSLAGWQPAIWPWMWSTRPAGFGLFGCVEGADARPLSGAASSIGIRDLCAHLPLFYYPQNACLLVHLPLPKWEDGWQRSREKGMWAEVGTFSFQLPIFSEMDCGCTLLRAPVFSRNLLMVVHDGEVLPMGC